MRLSTFSPATRARPSSVSSTKASKAGAASGVRVSVPRPERLRESCTMTPTVDAVAGIGPLTSPVPGSMVQPAGAPNIRTVTAPRAPYTSGSTCTVSPGAATAARPVPTRGPPPSSTTCKPAGSTTTSTPDVSTPPLALVAVTVRRPSCPATAVPEHSPNEASGNDSHAGPSTFAQVRPPRQVGIEGNRDVLPNLHVGRPRADDHQASPSSSVRKL